MIKYLLGLVLALNATAGLPPTTLGGQGGASPTTFVFKTPENQTTQISGVESLIETGNQNILANPGFEGTTGWTSSGGTFSYSTTSPISGLKSGVWDSNSAAQTLTGTAITIPVGLQDQEGFATCRIKTTSGTSTHTMSIYDGSTNLFTTNVRSSTAAELSSIKFKFPASGTVTLRFTAVNADEPSIQIDSCFIGPPSGTAVVDLNFLRLGTAWNDQGSNNSNAEASIGQFVTYNDAAAETPVDMTGGVAADLTLSRTTTASEILNGQASFKVVKAAANAQGEGVSTTLNVPPAYSGKRALINIPFRVTSGSVVQGDIKVFIYDVTNGVLITPFNNDLVGSNGTIQAMYDVPNSTSNIQMRVGFHFASTSSTAMTFVFDDAFVGPLEVAVGAVDLTTQDFTMTIGATTTPPTKGTIVYENANYKIVGDKMFISYQYKQNVAGSAGTGEYLFPIPNGYEIDTTRAPDSTSNITTILGSGKIGQSANGITASVHPLFVHPYNSRNLILSLVSSSGSALQDTASRFGSGTINFGNTTNFWVSFNAVIPIRAVATGTLTQSSTFNISQILASGTRVTTTPTRLGEYRTRSWNSGSFTLSDVSSGTISTSDGMNIFTRNGTAGVTAGPNQWDIFIGQNKNFELSGFAGTAKTIPISVTPVFFGTTVDSGLVVTYAPNSGLLTIVPLVNSGGSSRSLDPVQAYLSGYYDVLVSESASPMAIVAPNSSIIFDTGVNANGATNTTVRRFSNVSTVGNALTATQSGTNGDSVTVNENGNYSISFTDVATATTSNYAAITINGTALTTDPSAITYAQGFRAGSYNPSDEMWFVGSINIPLVVGDVIRFQRTNARLSTSSRVVAIVNQTSKR